MVLGKRSRQMKIEKNIWWRFTCRDCDSKLRAEPLDVRVDIIIDELFGDIDKEYYVKCPKCGNVRIVPNSKLNNKIRTMAYRKYIELKKLVKE